MNPDKRDPVPPREPPVPERRPWTRPELLAFGSFRKLTQSRAGSTGESGNFTMMSCL